MTKLINIFLKKTIHTNHIEQKQQQSISTKLSTINFEPKNQQSIETKITTKNYEKTKFNDQFWKKYQQPNWTETFLKTFWTKKGINLNKMVSNQCEQRCQFGKKYKQSILNEIMNNQFEENYMNNQFEQKGQFERAFWTQNAQ